MSKLIEILTDPLAIILYMYAGLWLWETLAPAKTLPKMRFWKLRGIAFFIFNFFLASVIPLLTDTYLARFQLVDFSHVNRVLAAFVGVLIYQGLLYFWHRALHTNNFLWKSFHQMHHSTERLDIPSAFYTGPLDTFGFTLLGSISFVLLLGLSPEAATLAVLFLTFLSLFQHSNIRTPLWLGYIIQRPEAHSMHHGRGVHRYNYSDFSFYDMLFKTFKNPRKHQEETGFYDGASERILDMLVMKDVSEPAKSK